MVGTCLKGHALEIDEPSARRGEYCSKVANLKKVESVIRSLAHVRCLRLERLRALHDGLLMVQMEKGSILENDPQPMLGVVI